MLVLAQSGATVYEAIIGQAGVIALLLIIVATGAKRWWVFGWQYNALEKRAAQEIKEWKTIALTGLGVGEKAADLIEAGDRRGRTE